MPQFDEALEQAAEQSDLQAAAARLARQLAREKERTETLVAAVYQAARDAAALHPIRQVDKPPAAARKRRGRPEVAVIHTTDWQCGKRTVSFDSEVLARRIAQMADKVAAITNVQRADHPVDEAVVILGGDMVEGVSIFPGQVWEVDATVYEQLFTAAKIMASLILRMLREFKTVRVFDVSGNHGRIGRRGDMPRQDNIDTMLYRIVSERLEGQPRLTWTHCPGWHQIIPIGDYRALVVHGDQIRSFGGNLPAYGILRKVNAWAAGVLEPFTDAYVGHFHTPQQLAAADGRKVWMTGSPESDNEFAREFVAATGTPSQTLNFVDPERGRVTAHYAIVLD